MREDRHVYRRTCPVFETVAQSLAHKWDSYVEVEINDRGPYAKGRDIDLSKRAATKIEMIEGWCRTGQDRSGSPTKETKAKLAVASRTKERSNPLSRVGDEKTH